MLHFQHRIDRIDVLGVTKNILLDDVVLPKPISDLAPIP